MSPRRHPRCSWEDGRGRCAERGAGDPPLCRTHYERAFYGRDEEPSEFETARDELLTTILDHPALHQFGRRLDDRVQGLFDQLSQTLERAAERAFDRPLHTRPEYQGPHSGFASEWPPRPRQKRHQAPPRPSSGPQLDDPRVILGFSPQAKLTRAIIKKRQRELARIFHTDTQGGEGYEDAMKRVNTAADALLSQLG